MRGQGTAASASPGTVNTSSNPPFASAQTVFSACRPPGKRTITRIAPGLAPGGVPASAPPPPKLPPIP